MRPVLAIAAALLVVLAGCTTGGDTTTTAPEDVTTAPTDVETTAPPDGVESTTTTTTTTADDGETTAETATPGTDDGTPTDDGTEMAENPPDPPSDRLGWEAGLWFNETIDVNNADGMNATERRLAVARSMARVEMVRQLEFPGNDTIPIDVISREEFRERNSGRNYSEPYRTFDNVKFEAMFFVGEDRDSLAVQESNRGSSVLGYYSPSNDSIVLISEGDLPQFDGEETLAQEVAHALQDFRFNLTAMQRNVVTRDGYNGQNGLIEGDGNLIDQLYVERCAAGWECIPAPNGSSSGGGIGADFHYGIYFMEFLPYSDGPGFITHYFEQGGWDRINEMYDNPPATAEQVVFPEKYESDPPVNVSLSDRTSDGWERVRPGSVRAGVDQPAYDTLGTSVLASMFMYTQYDSYNSSSLVSPFDFLNINASGGVNPNDPVNYDLAPATGWEGDRIHIYENDAGETGYVWRIAWESPEEAQEFADSYRDLLSHWGGSEAGENRYVISEDSPFADAFSLTVDGDTVTIVNAPTTDSLGAVFEPAE